VRKLMMYVSMVVVLGFVAGTLLGADAPKPKPQPKPLTANGVVKSYDADAKILVVTVKSEKGEATDMSFRLTDETQIKGAKGVEALTEGTVVTVAYTKDTMTAVAIKVAPAEKPKIVKPKTD